MDGPSFKRMGLLKPRFSSAAATRRTSFPSRGVLLQSTPLARASELARRVAGHCAALHAGLANVDALVELPGVVIRVTLGDTGTLLRGVLDLLRAGSKADGKAGGKRSPANTCNPVNRMSQWHGSLSPSSALDPLHRNGTQPPSSHIPSVREFPPTY